MEIILTISALESIAQLITVVLVFAFVLLITYGATRFIGNYQKIQQYNKNIEVIETFKVTNNKYIQIVRAGNKYLVIAICKDTITMLTELEEDSVIFQEMDHVKDTSFQEMLNKAKSLIPKK